MDIRAPQTQQKSIWPFIIIGALMLLPFYNAFAADSTTGNVSANQGLNSSTTSSANGGLLADKTGAASPDVTINTAPGATTNTNGTATINTTTGSTAAPVAPSNTQSATPRTADTRLDRHTHVNDADKDTLGDTTHAGAAVTSTGGAAAVTSPNH